MNKSRLLYGSILMLALSLVIWSCKDKFTEEDQMNLANQLEQDSIALSIQVYNASISAGTTGGRVAGLSGLTVKLAADGQVKTASSASADGFYFFKVKPGSVSGTISGQGYTTVNFTLTVQKPTDASGSGGTDANNTSNASVTLPVFSLDPTKVAKVTGNVTFEGDLLNQVRETVPNGKVTISFAPTQASLASYYDTYVDSKNADVDKLSIEGDFVATVTDGKYAINLPTAGDTGLTYDFRFSDFEADQKIAINGYINDPVDAVRDVVTIPTQFPASLTFFASNEFTVIPDVSVLQIDISAPPAAGTGAAATVKLLPTRVAPNLTIKDGYDVLASGSGYPVSSTTVPVTVNGGDYDQAVTGAAEASLTATTDANGRVTGITGTLGFGYRSQATLVVGGGGTGAVIRLNYASLVAPTFGTNNLGTSGTVITNGGSGYLKDVAPVAIVQGYDNYGNFIEGYAATTVNSNSADNGPNNNTGSIVNMGSFMKTPGGPNPQVFARLKSYNVTFRPVERVNAVARTADLNATAGQFSINGQGVNVTGTGYSAFSVPKTTASLRSLRGGSGAALEVEISSNSVTKIYVTSPGSGYPAQGKANFPAAKAPFSSTTGLTDGTALQPGATYVLNAYYGTGIKTQGVQ